jgi:predicted phosphate transport protein (TIGR00153 family)
MAMTPAAMRRACARTGDSSNIVTCAGLRHRAGQGVRFIRQIAALPYRTEGPALDAPVRILLITSRGTGRWVIPKGNVSGGLAPHAAAALEAEEEAGVGGSVSPIPLGSYRYRKRRGNGASLMVDVDVFPLCVTDERDTWKEQSERERRWFTLPQAAQAVDESDLRQLIRSFAPSEFKAAAGRTGVLQLVAQKSRVSHMFGWFQRLLPKTGNFFDLFEAHAVTIVAAADALARLFQGGTARADHLREIVEREHDADNVIREVLQTVRKTFLTPFDRGAITSLIGAMDDAVDEMNAAAAAVDLYEFTAFDQDMRDMTAIIVDGARVTAEAIPLLRDVVRNGARLHELTERLVRMEGRADEIHDAGLKKAFTELGPDDTMKFIVTREIYKHLERIVDALEDVANEIDGIVIDHA